MTDSVRMLMDGAIDYAGTFWPTSLPLEDVTANFRRYQSGPERPFVGRLVISLRDLPKLPKLVGPAAANWSVSVAAGQPASESAWQDTLELAAKEMTRVSEEAEFELGALEIALPPDGELSTLLRDLRGFQDAEVFVEVPPSRDLHETLAAITDSEWLAAKLRTGGPSPDHVPTADHLSEFILGCFDLELDFKLSAGLHHMMPKLRGDGSVERFGFFTTLAGAAIARVHDLSRKEFAALLSNPDPGAWNTDAKGISYLGAAVSLTEIDDTRIGFRGFGSCSIEDPLSELKSVLG